MEVIGKSVDDDGSIRWTHKLSDTVFVESVLLQFPNRNSVCVSTQGGCAYDCNFCATARMPFSGNLSREQILQQVDIALASAVKIHLPTEVSFMGMGEPLLNFAEVAKAAVSLRRAGHDLTMSTVGVPAGLRKLRNSGFDIRLQISLHAPSDELRKRLMPRAAIFPISEIIDEVTEFARGSQYAPTYNYVLLDGVNDSDDHFRSLCFLLSGLDAHIKISSFNEFAGSAFRASPRPRVDRFISYCVDRGISVYGFDSRGAHHSAACGNLEYISSCA